MNEYMDSVHFTCSFPQSFLLNGLESLMTIVVQVVDFIANRAAPTLAAHHVEA